MKILVLADVPCKALWDYYDESRLRGVDLILSAGDLPSAYLSFLVTFAHCPVLYIHGNHDEIYEKKPPEGCTCIDGDIYVYEGVRILGLGGSMRYRPGEHQYSEKQMCRRVRRLFWKIRWKRGFDILLTHAPASGINDGEDLCHKGFDVFRKLMEKYHPSYMIHGHVHMNYGNYPRLTRFGDTTVVNAYERYLLDVDIPGRKI